MKQADRIVVTAGSRYLDIDAYACCVAMRELLVLKGERAVAFSKAKPNYSVCDSLIKDGQMLSELPEDFPAERSGYIICDVSDPDYIKDGAPLERVVKIFDHHTGFEEYWRDRIRENAHIEFIGAAATLIYREWMRAGLLDRMTRPTALLLIAAILDNTLDLTSSIVTEEDKAAFHALCQKANVGKEWCDAYFSEVQDSVEADLKNALFNDLKLMHDHPILPECFAQLCVWDARRTLERLGEIRRWFDDRSQSWMLNIIDIKRRCSWLICDDPARQKKLAERFNTQFEHGVARTGKSYLRKEIIKITDHFQ